MASQRSGSGSRLIVGALLLLVACGGNGNGAIPDDGGGAGAGGEGSGSMAGGVGAACVPFDESQPTFSGLASSEINISVDHPACRAGGACVAVGFQGRVTCPYGQTEADLSLPDDDPQRCRVTDADGVPTAESVTVPVPPQLVARQPKDTVFCSCRCAGPDTTASYCACGAGQSCVELVKGLGLGSSPTEGSYCVPQGLEVKPQAGGATCSPDTAMCGDSARNP